MAFADIDKKAKDPANMTVSERRDYYKKKEEAKKVEVIAPQKVEVLPPVEGKGGMNITLPAPIQGMVISPKIEINMPDPAASEDSRWWSVGREVVETVKSMMLGAAAYALITNFLVS